MTVMVIGLGSMGRRRIRLLQKYDLKMKITGIDSVKERCEKAQQEYGINVFSSVEEACRESDIECAFICTSPLSHAYLITICLEKNMHVFTELNLVSIMYDENIKLANEKDKVLFLSSTFLYRKEIMYMQEKVQAYGENVNYMYHAGQYLPDWHPWESYQSFFVGQKKTNGCREFMAIEFPWIIKVFGNIKTVKAAGSKMSTLEIDYPDNYILFLEHENGNKGVVTIDIVSRKAIRNLEVFGENIYFTWNGTPDGLLWYDCTEKKDKKMQLYETVDKRSDYAASIIEDAYYSEISNFFQVIKGNEKAKYSFMEDKSILKIIDYIEEEVEGAETRSGV